MLRRVATSLTGFILAIAFATQLASAAVPIKVLLLLTQESTKSESHISIDGMIEYDQLFLPLATILKIAEADIPYRIDKDGSYVCYPIGATVKYAAVREKNGYIYVDAKAMLGDLGINAVIVDPEEDYGAIVEVYVTVW